MPGDCSPSRSVVSKMVILRAATAPPSASPNGDAPRVSFRSACAPTKGRVVAYSPLAGENGDKENGDEAEPRQADQTGGGQCCDA
jgi:hypothetical protein